jgi:hypothetical protein
MRFAKLVFWIAGFWGLVMLAPLYFLLDSISRSAPPPITHPEFFYGFTGVALAWQFAFLVIGSAPDRFRLMMLPAVLEKLSWVLTLAVLLIQDRITALQAWPAIPDGLLGVLFMICFFKVAQKTSPAAHV